ncbi:hypothetical protein BAE44_0022823, partial [Dichanthelium oligosanthes]
MMAGGWGWRDLGLAALLSALLGWAGNHSWAIFSVSSVLLLNYAHPDPPGQATKPRSVVPPPQFLPLSRSDPHPPPPLLPLAYAATAAAMGLFDVLYRVVMRRNAVYVTFVVIGAFTGERAVDY